MNLQCIVLGLLYAAISLGGLLPSDSVLQLPSNTSVAMTGINQTLGGWPPQLPYRIKIPGVGDLSMEINWYGEYAPRAWWDGIRNGFSDVRARLEFRGKASMNFICNGDYYSSFVRLSFPFHQEHTPDGHIMIRPLACKDAVRYVGVIQGLFYVYKDPPRELHAEIMINGNRLAQMQLDWNDNPSAWPNHYPFPTDVAPGLYILVQNESYGRDIDSDDTRLIKEVREALGYFIEDIKNEGAESGLLSRKTFYHAFVKLDILPGSEGAPQLIRADLISIVNGILALFFQPRNYGPREFEARIMKIGDQDFQWFVGRTVLTFVDDK